MESNLIRELFVLFYLALKLLCVFVQTCKYKPHFLVKRILQVQDPPVVFGPDIKRGDKFDTDLYKAYTKSGKTVKFVVWPVLLLHEAGPILCKGVAQGIPDLPSRPVSAPIMVKKQEYPDNELDPFFTNQGRNNMGYRHGISATKFTQNNDLLSTVGKDYGRRSDYEYQMYPTEARDTYYSSDEKIGSASGYRLSSLGYLHSQYNSDLGSDFKYPYSNVTNNTYYSIPTGYGYRPRVEIKTQRTRPKEIRPRPAWKI